MRNTYCIFITDAEGRMQMYRITAASFYLAILGAHQQAGTSTAELEAALRALAELGSSEPNTVQNQGRSDFEVE